jgi:hypothetical protein
MKPMNDQEVMTTALKSMGVKLNEEQDGSLLSDKDREYLIDFLYETIENVELDYDKIMKHLNIRPHGNKFKEMDVYLQILLSHASAAVMNYKG